MNTRPIAWVTALGVLACSGKVSQPQSTALLLEATACRPCHQGIVDTYLETAHYRTSAPATAETIRGSFAEGRNVLQTRVPSVRFKLEHRQQGFYQTASDLSRMTSRSERFDLVTGSGRKGQSYLYWRGGRLFELPVSYLTGLDQWINSPGYLDGQIDFDRPIPPRCLECHATTFQLSSDPTGLSYTAQFRLGITCEKCHGDGRRHIEIHAANSGAIKGGEEIRNPAHFPRDRKLDNCALCHSGVRGAIQPPFSYRPGEPLEAYSRPDSGAAVPDVHGNQIALLRQTKCFRGSPEMSCATCHDVHRTQRDLTELAQKCLACHRAADHKNGAEIGALLMTACVDCHMPDQRSNAIQINTPTEQFSPFYRSHAIAVYPAVSSAILQTRRSASRPDR